MQHSIAAPMWAEGARAVVPQHVERLWCVSSLQQYGRRPACQLPKPCASIPPRAASIANQPACALRRSTAHLQDLRGLQHFGHECGQPSQLAVAGAHAAEERIPHRNARLLRRHEAAGRCVETAGQPQRSNSKAGTPQPRRHDSKLRTEMPATALCGSPRPPASLLPTCQSVPSAPPAPLGE